jgi:hypothetical protein
MNSHRFTLMNADKNRAADDLGRYFAKRTWGGFVFADLGWTAMKRGAFICYTDVLNSHGSVIGYIYVSLSTPYGWVYVEGPVDVPKPSAFKVVADKEEVYKETKQWAESHGYTMGAYVCPTDGNLGTPLAVAEDEDFDGAVGGFAVWEGELWIRRSDPRERTDGSVHRSGVLDVCSLGLWGQSCPAPPLSGGEGSLGRNGNG